MASSWGWPSPSNWKSTTFTKTRLEPVRIEILPVSILLSNGGYKGILLRYITISYLNWPRNGEPSDFKVWKKCLNYDDLCSKTHLFQTLFSDFKIWRLAISRPVEVGKSYIPQKKALLPTVWKQVWNWKNLYHDRLHTSFSKSSAFSVKRAWSPSEWCHAQYLSWF